jgi:CHASE3 domain sensor protein
VAESIRKTGLRLAVPLLLALIVLNAFFAIRNLSRIREATNLRLENSLLQANISAVLLDLSEMESGQRGYILTNNPSYLEPFENAKRRLSEDFSSLREKLATRPSQERQLLTELEATAQAKIGEAEKTIQLRRDSYRKRAFDMVDTNVGKNYMDDARAKLGLLSAAAASSLAAYERASHASIDGARRTTLLANLGLLVFTALLFFLSRLYTQRLELEVAQRTEALRRVNSRLEMLTFTISEKFRDLLGGLRGSADALLQTYGDFLPRQGRDYAQHIQGAAGETNQLIDDLLAETHVRGAA